MNPHDLLFAIVIKNGNSADSNSLCTNLPSGQNTVVMANRKIGEVSSVYAKSERRAINNDMDDTTSMIFDFKNGATGYLSMIFATGNIWRMYIMGTKGWLEMRGEHCLVVSDLDEVVETREYDVADILSLELEAFAKACEGEVPYPVPIAHAVHGIAVLGAVDESARSGTKVMVNYYNQVIYKWSGNITFRQPLI